MSDQSEVAEHGRGTPRPKRPVPPTGYFVMQGFRLPWISEERFQAPARAATEQLRRDAIAEAERRDREDEEKLTRTPRPPV